MQRTRIETCNSHLEKMGVVRLHTRITADISQNSTSLLVHDVCPVPTRFVIKVDLHF
jgi:hypothetical protein